MSIKNIIKGFAAAACDISGNKDKAETLLVDIMTDRVDHFSKGIINRVTGRTPIRSGISYGLGKLADILLDEDGYVRPFIASRYQKDFGFSYLSDPLGGWYGRGSVNPRLREKFASAMQGISEKCAEHGITVAYKLQSGFSLSEIGDVPATAEVEFRVRKTTRAPQ